MLSFISSRGTSVISIGGRGAQALLLQQRLSIVQDDVSFSDMVEKSSNALDLDLRYFGFMVEEERGRRRRSLCTSA